MPYPASDFPPYPLPSNSVVFLDWDDTLLCSSHLASRGFNLSTNLETLDAHTRLHLGDLEQCAISVLAAAKEHGDVYIVTNADQSWVELSAAKFMPRMVPIMKDVTIFSARYHFERYSPESPLDWKLHAFRWLVRQYGMPPRHILSLGDSHVEREAIRSVSREILCSRIKTIKFADKPSIEQLKRQLELIASCFRDVFAHPAELDLALTISLPAPPEPCVMSLPSEDSACCASPAPTATASASPTTSDYESKQRSGEPRVDIPCSEAEELKESAFSAPPSPSSAESYVHEAGGLRQFPTPVAVPSLLLS